MREHRALGLTGRPRGVHQGGQIIRPPPDRGNLAAATGERVECEVASVLHGDQMPQPRQLRRPGGARQRPRPAGISHDRDRPRMTHHIGRLGRGERRIDRTEHRPGLQDRPPSLQELQAIRQHHRHYVPRLDAQISKAGGQGVGAGVELAVAHRPPPRTNKRLVGDAAACARSSSGTVLIALIEFDLLIGAWVMTRLIRRNRSEVAVVRPQTRRLIPCRALIGAAIRREYLAAMLTPKVIEIQNLSAHRRDVPVVRPAAQTSKER